MYDADRINDHILQNHEYSQWKETKFDSSDNDFTYIFMSCLFTYKSKTLTHLKECLLKYKDAIRLNTNTKEKQMKMLEALFNSWGHSNIHLQMIIEILFNNYILDYLYLVEFIVNLLKERLSKDTPLNEIYFNFILLDYIIEHSSLNLNRLKKELSEEQSNIAKGEAELESESLKKMELLEEYIERLKYVISNIHKEVISGIKGLPQTAECDELLKEKLNYFLRKYE
jgi:hypothetical protein